ncbi:hypothetical protein V6N11_044171 [Hibiscus sabdariffa]|uniref:RNase H type-1 domain-containing protein n=1 Tax=Hibiscus sabdariffa TaxID=183260 RepID=A0ABR2RF05_9ROSI
MMLGKGKIWCKGDFGVNGGYGNILGLLVGLGLVMKGESEVVWELDSAVMSKVEQAWWFGVAGRWLDSGLW